MLIRYYLGSQIKKNELARHVACMMERRDACSIVMGDLRKGEHLKDSGFDGRITLKWILGGGRDGLNCSALG